MEDQCGDYKIDNRVPFFHSRYTLLMLREVRLLHPDATCLPLIYTSFCGLLIQGRVRMVLIAFVDGHARSAQCIRFVISLIEYLSISNGVSFV